LIYIKVNIMYNVLYLWYNRLLWKLKKTHYTSSGFYSREKIAFVVQRNTSW
jgi:hypothetical protein